MENTTYEMLVETDFDAVFAISLVTEPAIEEDFILLSKNQISINLAEVDFKPTDTNKRIVCGAVLVPDKVIPRKGYNIVFSKETIRKISENFLMNGNKDNITLQHKANVNGIKLVESWIVEDSKNDKSKALGFDVPDGTWMASYKILNDDIYNEFIESKILRGFSIEGNFTKKEVEMSKETDCDGHSCVHDHLDFHSVENLSVEDQELFEVYLATMFKKQDIDSYFKWQLGAKDHCDICIKYSNMAPKTLREWAKIAIPKTINNTKISVGLKTKYPYVRKPTTRRPGVPVYGTWCEENCDCQLIMVGAAAKVPQPTPPQPTKTTETTQPVRRKGFVGPQ